MNDQTTITPAAADFVCPDGPECQDPVCQAERRKLGILTITPEAAAVRPQRDTLNATHTPGAWAVHRDTWYKSGAADIISATGTCVAYVTADWPGVTTAAADANARLIAAAPELLAALTDLEAIAGVIHGRQHAGAGVRADYWNELFYACNTAKAAIARAKGGAL